MTELYSQTTTTSATSTAVNVGIFLIPMVFAIGVIVVALVSIWRIFQKAGKPGWAAIVPIYNVVIMLQIAGKPLWWIILLFIPIANIVVLVLINIALAEKFGKGVGFALGLIFLSPIFWCILGFGDAQYLGGMAPPQGFEPVMPAPR